MLQVPDFILLLICIYLHLATISKMSFQVGEIICHVVQEGVYLLNAKCFAKVCNTHLIIPSTPNACLTLVTSCYALRKE